jgi:hypothetical protein
VTLAVPGDFRPNATRKLAIKMVPSYTLHVAFLPFYK